MTRVPTIRELIAEYGVHAGTERPCMCCGKFMLFRIPTNGPEGYFYVCSYCDTERG